MAKQRKNLLVPHGVKYKLDEMTDAEAGKLFKALVEYSISGEEAEFEDRFLRSTFKECAQADKENELAYQQECDRRSKAALEREEVKRLQKAQEGIKSTTVKSAAQESTKSTAVQSVALCGTNSTTGTDKSRLDENRLDIKEKDPKGSQKKGGEPPSPTPDLSGIEDETLRAKTAEWLKYKEERREKYKNTGLKSFIAQVKNNAEKCGAEAVCRVIEDSMSSGYKGVMWDRLKRINSPPKPLFTDDFDLPEVKKY